MWSPYRDDDGGASVAAQVLHSIAIQAAQETDTFVLLLTEVRNALSSRAVLTPAQMENPSPQDTRAVEAIAREVVTRYDQVAHVQGLPPLPGDIDSVVQSILDEIFGFGPIAPLMNNPDVEEIEINGPEQIYVVTERGRELTPYRFRGVQALMDFVNRAAAYRGRKIDRANPMVDVKMRDGSRLHAIMDPLVDNEFKIAVTIRRHRLVARTLDDLVARGTISAVAAEFLRWAVRGRLNIIISGGTSSGKTNFLNALAAEIPPNERVITIEDTPELRIVVPDWVALVTRRASEGVAAITQEDLVRETLRMRPDRILTGEARGAEIVAILEAANTGHDGQAMTIHANSPKHVITRVETLYLKARDVPLEAIRRELADGFQLIIHLKRVSAGPVSRRVVTDIVEITGRMEGSTVELQPIFQDKGQGLAWTGLYPRTLLARIEERAGLALDFNSLVGGRR